MLFCGGIVSAANAIAFLSGLMVSTGNGNMQKRESKSVISLQTQQFCAMITSLA
jgi:hypothetical protein